MKTSITDVLKFHATTVVSGLAGPTDESLDLTVSLDFSYQGAPYTALICRENDKWEIELTDPDRVKLPFIRIFPWFHIAHARNCFIGAAKIAELFAA